MLRTLWKRCAAWGTDFASNYRSNIFFRTTTKVLLWLIGGTSVIIGYLYFALNRMSGTIEQHLVAEIQDISYLREGPILRALQRALDAITWQDLALVLLGLTALVLLLGFWIARIALKPTRDALASQKLFIGNVAHELRTPLSIIKTNMEVTLLDDALDPELRQTLRDNVDELDRSADIINNLLSLNTLLNPKDIPFTAVDLGAIAKEAVSTLTPLAERKAIQVTVTSKDFVLVHGNATALLQVALNLVKNALHHTPKGGKVDIVVEPDYRGYIELSVRDTGTGIAPDDLVHIFEPFYQADRSRSAKHRGSGLGLTIVSEIVKLHKGKVRMHSKKERGTTAIVAIPCAQNDRHDLWTNTEQSDAVTMDFTRSRHVGSTHAQ